MQSRITLPVTLFLASTFSIEMSAKTDDKSVWQYEDVFNIEYAASPKTSPDNSMIIYERRAMDIMSDGIRTNLWSLDLKDGSHRPFLSGKSQYRSLEFSPDGKRVAYVSNSEGDNQLYVKWLDTGDIARVSEVQSGISNISWSPNGQWIAFSMFKKMPSKGIFNEMPKQPRGAKWAGTATYIDQKRYRGDGVGILPKGNRHIFVVPSEGGTVRQISKGQYNHGGMLSWTPDSKNILFSADRHEDWQSRSRESDIYRINIDTGETVNITSKPGPETRPLISPYGKRVAFLGFNDKKMSSQNYDIFIMNIDGTRQKNLTKSLDRPINSPKWDSKGKGVYFSYDDHGQKYIGYVSVKGKIKTKLAQLGGQSLGRPYTSGEFAVTNDNQLVFTQANTNRPADLALLSKRGKVTKLTNLNEDLLGHKKTANIKALTVKSSVDGREIQAWYALPPHFDSSKKYPLILEIHGGPHTAYGPNFSTEVQLMAAKGYVVVWSNPRGSTSYGEDFANLIHHKYPSEDHNDLMDVVDGMVRKEFIDKNNLFVTGGSGGGVLTAWMIGNTDRFKAAVVAKPVINWLSFALTADAYPYFAEYWMPGMPWEQADHLWKHSPLSLVGNVNTPTMLLTGEVDYRTPMSETEQYYQALQLRGVESAMVRIPKASHGIAARPSNLIQKVGNILAWFERYKTDGE
ncbi:S9 family peptidase [Pseudoalteromonas phenolica]|nr:S9 family peptidase [Pseudoalteromonas phenolica]